MMRIAVISELELGCHKAHAINVVKTAGGFARLGHQVTLLCRVPERALPSRTTTELLAQYGEHAITCEFGPGKPSEGEAGSLATGRWAAAQALGLGADFVYARHFAGAIEAAGLGLTTVMETHAHIGTVKPILDEALKLTARRERSLAGVVTISSRLAAHYIDRGALASRVHTVPDGVDLEMFAPPRSAARSPFSGPGPHALYCGHLYDYKGIPTILGAAHLCPHVQFHLVGGLSEDIARVRATVASAQLKNITVYGAVPHAMVPACLWSADVLLLPPSAKDPSAAWTSPVKLGEYLAAEKPIVAAAIPGLMDWVAPPAVRWFAPDDSIDLARAIDASLSETPGEREVRAAAARALAKSFSYPERARRILAAGGAAGAASTSTEQAA